MSTHAYALLTPGRSVLLERAGATGAVVRQRLRLAQVIAGRHLTVLGGSRPGRLGLDVGDAVTLSIPVSGNMWQFATAVAERDDTAAERLLLDWPTTIECTTGRRHPRIAAVCAARVREDHRAARAICTYTLDLSDTGVQFAFPGELPPGAQLDIQLRCAASTVAFTAEVRWRSIASTAAADPMFRVGAAIRSIGQGARRQLLAFLRDNAELRIASLT